MSAISPDDVNVTVPGEAPEAVPDEVAEMFALDKKKKKKKPKKTDDAALSAATTSCGERAAEGYLTEADPPAYSYDDLLERAVELLHQHNPEYSEKRRYNLKPPQLMKIGTKKTLWVNFQEICKMMRRSSEHVYQFMMAELGTEGSIDGNQRLVIRGKFVPKYIESLLRKYLLEYVKCQMCSGFNTTLTRDQVSRLFFVHCQDCGSSRSVTAIRSGYHATTKADRRALRK